MARAIVPAQVSTLGIHKFPPVYYFRCYFLSIEGGTVLPHTYSCPSLQPRQSEVTGKKLILSYQEQWSPLNPEFAPAQGAEDREVSPCQDESHTNSIYLLLKHATKILKNKT